MRTVVLAALGLMIGACATLGGDRFDFFGIYDVVTVNGEALPYRAFTAVSFELRTDDVIIVTIEAGNQADPVTSRGTLSWGDPKDGCVPFKSTPVGSGVTDTVTGSICGTVMTAEFPGYWTATLHKRK